MSCIPTPVFRLDVGILAKAWTHKPHAPIFGNSQHSANRRIWIRTYGGAIR